MIRTLLKKLPFPLCALMLACASAGNLLKPLSPPLYLFCGGLALILGLLWAVRMFLFPGQWRREMEDPSLASVGGTFSMGLMILSGYALPFSRILAILIWAAGLSFHIVLMVWFTVHFMMPPVLSKVYASYFIVYVGIAAAALPSSALGQAAVGLVCSCFAMAVFFPLLLLLILRCAKEGEPEDFRKPLLGICAAPSSLCLAAYLTCASRPRADLVCLFLLFSLILYTLAMLRLFFYLRLPWTPAFSAYTFPTVISAVAVQKAAGFLSLPESLETLLRTVAFFQTVIACLILTVVLIRMLICVIHT